MLYHYLINTVVAGLYAATAYKKTKPGAGFYTFLILFLGLWGGVPLIVPAVVGLLWVGSRNIKEEDPHGTLSELFGALVAYPEPTPPEQPRRAGDFSRVPSVGLRIPKKGAKEAPNTYMGATQYNGANLARLASSGGLFIDEKMDGRYINIIVQGQNVGMVSRSGKPSLISNASLIADSLNISAGIYGGEKDIVIIGEVMLRGYERQEANGIITALVSAASSPKRQETMTERYGESYEDLLGRVHVVLWDVIPANLWKTEQPYKMPYRIRREQLKAAINVAQCRSISFVKSYTLNKEICENLENLKIEIGKIYHNILKEGGEGIIIKSQDTYWRNGTTPDMMKVKPVMEVSLVCADHLADIGPNRNNKYTSLEGDISITMGYPKAPGTIVDVRCNGITDTGSLLHPRIIGVRDDITKADSSAKIWEIWKSVTETAEL